MATKRNLARLCDGSFINVPVVIARRDSRVTEGSVVSINYFPDRYQKDPDDVSARRNLPEGSKVLIIDDFMKAGGTVQGMKDLLHEFNAEVVGVGCLPNLEWRSA